MFDKFQLMNTGMVILIPVQSFPLNPFFNVFNRWQLPLQFFRQTAGYFIRTDTHMHIEVDEDGEVFLRLGTK